MGPAMLVSNLCKTRIWFAEFLSRRKCTWVQNKSKVYKELLGSRLNVVEQQQVYDRIRGACSLVHQLGVLTVF